MAKLTKCANCKRRTGGALRLTGKGWVHHRCEPIQGTRDHAKNLYQFSSTHISENPNAGPVQVNSLAHLRKLEKEHGVYSVVANLDEKNWNDPPQQRPQFRSR